MGRKHKKQQISFADAMEVTPDDLPDGAFFAMAHEIAGLDYGDGFAQLANQQSDKTHKCDKCNRKFRTPEAARMHSRDAHKV